jgi:hypothetical protein
MGRNTKIGEVELLDYLGSKDRPFPLREIAGAFDVCKGTARKTVSKARKNGHPIIPTTQGEYYIVRIKTAEQLLAVLNAVGWTSRTRNELARIGRISQSIADTATKKIAREADEIKQLEAS